MIRKFGKLRAVLAGGVAVLLASGSLAAMEELTAHLSEAALTAQVEQSRFQSDMEAYTRSVGQALRTALEADLKQVAPSRLQLAESGRGNRG